MRLGTAWWKALSVPPVFFAIALYRALALSGKRGADAVAEAAVAAGIGCLLVLVVTVVLFVSRQRR